MFCAFKDEGNNLKKCVKCGFSLITTEVPERIYKQCTKDSPSLVEKVGNLVSSAVTLVKTGFSEQKTAKERLDICQGTETLPKCEHFNNGSCKLCGCHMIAKVQIAGVTCPIGKW